jgi:DNA-binding HxlR family transcriptional regulator
MDTEDQLFNFKVFYVLKGKWKMEIIREIGLQRTLRFSEIRKKIPSITTKILTTRLRELERDGIVLRRVYAVVPPKVEYTLTHKGEALCPTFKAMRDWSS